MSPDKLAVELRPRNGWEAIDLGIQLARHCARPLFAATGAAVLLTSLLVFAIVHAFDQNWYFWTAMIIWWLKPVYDRVALHVLSHAVFGEEVGVRSTLRALPGILRRSALFPGLTWRRLSTQRSLRLPVDQLEGLRGKEARARFRILNQRVGSHALGLLFCLAQFEWILVLGLFGLGYLLVPDGESYFEIVREALFDSEESSGWIEAAVLGCYLAAIIFLEPFYVAGGFGLYLKRRTDLEAWDIELQFRRLSLGGALTALAALCVSVVLLMPPAPAQAATTAQPAAPDRQTAVRNAGPAVREVLKDPDFGQEQMKKRWRWKKEDKKEEKRGDWPAWIYALYTFFAAIANALALSLRAVGLIALAVVLAVLTWLLYRHLQALKRARARPAPPDTLAGMNIRPDSLPGDIGRAVRELIAAGKIRQALALLYRASLSRLAHSEHIGFEPGDTEGDCLRRVRHSGSNSQAYFTRLTESWQTTAYARRVVDADAAEALCADWLQTFASAPA